MLKIKLIKTKCKNILKIKKIDSKKINSINSKKIGFLDTKKKKIFIKFYYIKNIIKKGSKVSKGFKKIFRAILNKKYDIQIL
ncbi:hypothetical protein [Candidatus Vidania fulgoroideorum]